MADKMILTVKQKHLLLIACQSLAAGKMQTGYHEGLRKINIEDKETSEMFTIVERAPYGQESLHPDKNKNWIYELRGTNESDPIGYFDIGSGEFHQAKAQEPIDLSSFDLSKSAAAGSGR